MKQLKNYQRIVFEIFFKFIYESTLKRGESVKTSVYKPHWEWIYDYSEMTYRCF